jgi:hypothetical protein
MKKRVVRNEKVGQSIWGENWMGFINKKWMGIGKEIQRYFQVLNKYPT